MLILRAHEPILNVLVNCVVEEKRILLYQAKLRSPPIEVNVVETFATDGDCAIAKVFCNAITTTKLIPSRYEADYRAYAFDMTCQRALSRTSCRGMTHSCPIHSVLQWQWSAQL
jgi:hypothetical protein